MKGMACVLFVAAGSGEAQLLPLGELTVMNTETTGRQAAPAVAVDAAGNHVVVRERDADGAGSVTATDALAVLTPAVGGDAELNCPVCA